MHGDRKPDENPERLVDSECDANANPLGERVQRHYRDDQERFPGIRPDERPEMQLTVAADDAA